MSQDIIDDVVAAASYDANIDRGWTEIKTATGSKADVETIFNALQKLYWEGVMREVASAIVALGDFDEHHPDSLPTEAPSKEDLLSSDSLEGLLKLWNPFDNGAMPGNKSKPTIESLKTDIEERVARCFEESLRTRRARSLLQSLGLLDINFVREHRKPIFRSWGQRPQVDYTQEPMLMARQCSECRHCIRSFHFYECVKGCREHMGDGILNVVKVKPPEKRTGDDFQSSSIEEIQHQISVTHILRAKHPYLLCPPCLAFSLHPREHLRAVRGFATAGDKDVMEFARELDIWEDHLDGRSLLSFGTIVLDKLASVPGNRVSSRHFFPAGNAHLAVMFGPLLIENGMTRDPGGALISLRNTPNCTASSSKEFMEFWAEPSDWSLNSEGEEVVHDILLSVSARRRLYSAMKPTKERRFMSCRKQVSGGAFTGHCQRLVDNENEIVIGLSQCTDLWKSLKNRSGIQADYRNLLKNISRGMTEIIKKIFDYEVNKHLVCFAERLHKLTKLQYNRLSNNCQDFCNAMLLNDDIWDKEFSLTYPAVPSNRIHETKHVHLRYMMSFASKMQHPRDEMLFVRPLASSLSLYDSFGQNDADLIDHVTSIRLRVDPESSGLALSTVTHDELLLKDAGFTCPQEEGGKDFVPRKPCTQASHILDGPHDNISVLTIHIHRQRAHYTVPSKVLCTDELLSTHPSSAWLANRLEVLHRLLLLNTYLASITAEFESHTTDIRYGEIGKAWRPPSSFFARAWHSNIRNGNQLVRPTWLEEIKTREYASVLTAATMLHTHPWMQTRYVWKTRVNDIKRRLLSEKPADKDDFGVFKSTPWTNCGCETCVGVFAVQNCRRATSYAASQSGRKPKERRYSKNHPDYVDLTTLRASIGALSASIGALEQTNPLDRGQQDKISSYKQAVSVILGTPEQQGNDVIDELLRQLDETPEYKMAE